MNTKTVGALSVINVEKKFPSFSKKKDGNMSLKWGETKIWSQKM